MTLKQTPLYPNCVKAKARMVPFAGWEMPIHFSGLVLEHHAVRKSAGLFDISHMGVLFIEGTRVKDALQKLVPTDLYQIGLGEACYTVLLNKSGGIIDDLIIYDLGRNPANNECLMIIINAACNDSDVDWIKKQLNSKEISISDAKEESVLMALQGPQSREYLRKVLGKNCEEPLKKIPRFGHQRLTVGLKNLKEKTSIFIARTGYTGEEGFEILLESNAGKILWEELINEGVTPCGLGARDTLRLEAAMHLYGNDITEETTPFEAGLGWLVHLEMPKQFIGREALEKQSEIGISRKLIGLEIQGRGIGRKGYQIFHEEKAVGQITSGTWSPTLEKAIALAYLPKELAKLGTNVQVKIRDKLHPAMVIKKPFYRSIS